ncbi:MAG: tyrosine-type recombinase/integrase [Chloroflexota bacterium]|nr:tyrosine-type recombinase/integrase [Chloroflexota bacterium]
MNSLTTFENYLTAQDYSQLTIKGYVGDTRRFMHWFSEHREQTFSIKAIQPQDVQTYRQQLLVKGQKPNTINRKIAAIVAFGKWGVAVGRVDQNPGLHVRNLDSVSLAPKWLDKNELAAFIRAAEDDLVLARQRYPRLWILRLRDTAMVITLVNTGLRVRELCALTLDDVEISARKGQATVNGKGFKQRTIPLNTACRQILNEWLQYRPGSDKRALFINQRRATVRPRSAQRAVKRIAEQAGLGDDVTPHTLRHTFAKSLINEGVTLEKVAKLLGHSSLNTTRIYVTPSEKDLEKAVNSLEDDHDL